MRSTASTFAAAIAFVAVAALVVAGSVATAPVGDAGDRARVVVAVPDSASNPYHEFFHSQPVVVTQELLDEFGVDDDHVLHLTRTGNWRDDFEDDAALWARVNQGELYWFAGTNLFGISFSAKGVPLVAEESDRSHGIGTTAAVMAANPEAIVIAVEGINDESETWAFTTPFVDVVSTSYGPLGSLPLPGHINDSHHGVVDNGKVHVGAADNTPALSPFDNTSGPWWSIGVAGLHEDEPGRGREALSGTAVDVVSDFTQELPYCSRCEEGTDVVSGTSFATPRTAGVISRIILDGRRAAGHAGGIVTQGVDQPALVVGNGLHVTNWDLRRALEEAAWYPSVEDGSLQPDLDTRYPVPAQAPWTVMGWGLVSPDPAFDVVAQANAHLGFSDEAATRVKSDEACAWMTANMQLRYQYWDNADLESQSRGQSERPYLAC